MSSKKRKKKTKTNQNPMNVKSTLMESQRGNSLGETVITVGKLMPTYSLEVTKSGREGEVDTVLHCESCGHYLSEINVLFVEA